MKLEMKKLSRAEKYADLRIEVKEANQQHEEDVKTRKKSIMYSILTCVLLCCISAAITSGATFAWFTSDISNKDNSIESGMACIDLLIDNESELSSENKGTYSSIANSASGIFSNINNMQPGETQVVHLRVKNFGDLAIQYKIVLNIVDSGLAKALDLLYIDENYLDEENTSKIVFDGNDDNKNWYGYGSVSGIYYEKVQNIGQLLNPITDVTNIDGSIIIGDISDLLANETKDFVLMIHMREDAPVECLGKSISIDANVVATQTDSEKDGFNSSDYDKNVVLDTVGTINFIDVDTLTTIMNFGEKGRLCKDLELNDNFKLTDSFSIDLNGYNLSFADSYKFNYGSYNITVTNTGSADATIVGQTVKVGETVTLKK